MAQQNLQSYAMQCYMVQYPMFAHSHYFSGLKGAIGPKGEKGQAGPWGRPGLPGFHGMKGIGFHFSPFPSSDFLLGFPLYFSLEIR